MTTFVKKILLEEDKQIIKSIISQALLNIKNYISVRENDEYIYLCLLSEQLENAVPISVWREGDYSLIDFVYNEVMKLEKRIIRLVFNKHVKEYIRNNRYATGFLEDHPEL